MGKKEAQINLQETELIPFVFDIKPLSKIFPEEKSLVLLLDYDGTLSPIVNHPEDAHLSDSMRDVLQSCAAKFTTAIISGRDMDDVTDEDAFRTLYTKGLGILVGNHGNPSAAGYRLRDVDEVRKLLNLLSSRNK